MNRLHARLVSLDVFRRHEHQEFIDKHLMNIDRNMTFNNLWARLGNYWDFLNFDLLEHVINKFGNAGLKHKMESYKHDLQSFRMSTRLCDFIDCWPVRGQAPPEMELREFVAKVGHHWDHCTLEDLDMLEGAITRKFFLPKLTLRLSEIKPGSIIIMWLIPALFVKGLQEAIEGTSSEFFMEHKIEAVTIAGQDCYPSLRTSKHSGHLQELSSSTPTVSITPPQSNQTQVMPTHLGDPYYSGSSSSGYYSGSSHSGYYSGSSHSGYYSGSSHSGYYSGSSHSGYYIGSSHSGYYIGSSHSGYYSGSSSSGYYSGSSSSGYFETRPLPQHIPRAAEKYVRKKCVDEISQCVKLLSSVEQYLSKAEVEADPSLPLKYKDYLLSTPAIRAALYTTFNARMAAEVFAWSLYTESSPPTTMTELFTAFTLKTLVDHLSTHAVYHKQQLKVTFSDLPTDMYKQYQDLCRMAYEGILNRQQLVFSASHLPTGFAPLGLMQEVPQPYTEGRTSSYHFIHLTLQEYLAAVHISQLPAHEQTRLFQEHVNSGHFKMTMRFLAGHTKLANIPPDVTMRTKLNYFHFLFEAKDTSMTTKSLGSDEMFVESYYSWTPLDYYVTGHAISHSNWSWRLNFRPSSIDDEKFELFCQGCATPRGAGCRGYISYAHFSYNDLTFKSIQSFVNISPHILQKMRVLYLGSNKLNGSACDLLAKTIPLMSRLEELYLGGNPIGSGGAVEVTKALCDSGLNQSDCGSIVKGLWLYNTGIGEPDCEALCVLLKSSHSLQHLDIHQNKLSSESVASIITGLSHNSSLTTLNISNSHFSMAHVNSLASVLKDHSKCTLTKLYLEDCHISSEGAVELAATLCKNSTLKHLDLDHNPIGVEGASSMSDMLQHNTPLEVLWLHDDSVGEEGVHQLINSLKLNQTLKELVLPGNYKSETSDHRIHW